MFLCCAYEMPAVMQSCGMYAHRMPLGTPARVRACVRVRAYVLTGKLSRAGCHCPWLENPSDASWDAWRTLPGDGAVNMGCLANHIEAPNRGGRVHALAIAPKRHVSFAERFVHHVDQPSRARECVWPRIALRRRRPTDACDQTPGKGPAQGRPNLDEWPFFNARTQLPRACARSGAVISVESAGRRVVVAAGVSAASYLVLSRLQRRWRPAD
eukprot:158793-Chlamydomonas_euryale.AAC.9